MSSPSILVLWYQRLVLTTMMSPGLSLASMSPWHAHQHSGGGRSSQRLVPDTWACHELRSTLSMCTWAPGPGVPAICHTSDMRHHEDLVTTYLWISTASWVEWTRDAEKLASRTIPGASRQSAIACVIAMGNVWTSHYLRLTNRPSYIPVPLSGASHSKCQKMFMQRRWFKFIMINTWRRSEVIRGVYSCNY